MRDGYVYVVQAIDVGWIKIGWAKDVARRMATVATNCGDGLTLLGCVRGTQAVESAMQRQFRACRVAYDWFYPSEDLIDFARGLPSPVVVSFVGTARASNRSSYFRRVTGKRDRDAAHAEFMRARRDARAARLAATP